MAEQDPMEKALEELMAGMGASSTPSEPPAKPAAGARESSSSAANDAIGDKMSEVDAMAADLEELLSSGSVADTVAVVKAEEDAKIAEDKMGLDDMESALASALATPATEEVSKSFDDIEETWEEAETPVTAVAAGEAPAAAGEAETLYQAAAPADLEDVVVVEPEKLSEKRKRFYVKTTLGVLTAATIAYVSFFYCIQPVLRWYYYSKLEAAVSEKRVNEIDRLLITSEGFGMQKEKYMRLSDISLANRDLPRSLGFARKAFESEPKYVPALNRIAQVYLLQGRIDEAENQTRQNLIIDPNNLESMVIQANAYFKKRDIDKAKRIVSDVLARDRNYVPALELSRDISVDLKNYAQALTVQQKLTDLKRNIPRPQRFLDLGRIHYAAGDFSRAESVLREAYVKDPSLWEAGYFLAKSQLALGQYNLAAAQISKTIAEAPAATLDMYYVRAVAHYHLDDIRVAIAELQRIRTMNPKFAPMFVLLGEIYVNTYGDFVTGLKFLEQARDLNYVDDDFLKTMGVAYFHLKRYREALETWKPILPKVGPTESLLLRVSACLMHLNQLPLAEAVLSKMYYAGSRSTAIYNNLGVLHELTGRNDLALKYYFRATQLAISQNRHDSLIPQKNFDRLISGGGAVDIDENLMLKS